MYLKKITDRESDAGGDLNRQQQAVQGKQGEKRGTYLYT